MKNGWSIMILLLFIFSGQAQVNLVPNSSFEAYSTCPDGAGEINYSPGWISPTTGSPDYFNSCFDSSMSWTMVVDIPLNALGNQSAIGNAYAGLLAWYANPTTYREYIQVQLLDSLIANQKYFVSFYVSLSDSSRFSTDALGATFSQNPINRADYDALGNTPQIENPSGAFLTDKTNWRKIAGSFNAQGGEKFITIGNFKKDSITDTLRVMPNLSPSPDFNGAYYYIDQVCVSTDSVTCNMPIAISMFSPPHDFILFNSVTNELFIKSVDVYQLQVISAIGEMLYSNECYGPSKLNLSNYSSGFYLVTLSSGKTISSKKIIINH